MTDDLASIQALIGGGGEASLGTLEGDQPFLSATAYLFEREEAGFGTFYLLLSRLARHTKNIERHAKASLLILAEEREKPIHERARVTVTGEITRSQDAEKRRELKAQYLRAFPRSEIFLSLPDFSFYEFIPEEVHWVGGFGRARSWMLQQ